jgi:phage terminase small subunit
LKGKKRTPKKSDVGAPKRRRFVQGLIDGKSMRRAALDAGYSKSMAKNAQQGCNH